MNFAALLAAEINKSKSSPTSTATSKYAKRSDIEAERKAAYEAEQALLERQRLEKANLKRAADDAFAEKERVREEKRLKFAEEARIIREKEERDKEAARRKRLRLPDLPDGETPLIENGDVSDVSLSSEELTLKLRELNEPSRLFGEDDDARLKRYKKLTAPKTIYYGTTLRTTLLPVPEAEMLVPEKVPSSVPDKELLFRQLASYFDLVLTEWSSALSSRSESVKASSSGKIALQSYITARANLLPLIKQFEKETVEESILSAVVEIVRSAQKRRYVDANDSYLRVSIGKAAWPIGVTMVGIHERSAREKIHEKDTKAHIMSDEVTRKLLQGVKMCLSFAQTRWPPDDQMQLMG